ncbi:MAG: trigger factor [Elusimicrobiota bacterium]|nr:trigger factor [Elusimicrobiota bacterium]
MGLFSAMTKSDKVKSKKLKEEGCLVTLSVEIPAQEVDDATQTSMVRLQQRAKVPGFRPGKAPLDVIKRHFSGHAREDAMDQLIRKHVPAAVEEHKLRLVESPTVEDVKWKQGEPMVLTVRLEVAPVPTAKDYLKIPVERKKYPGTDEAVTKRLDEIREAHARLEKSPDEAVAKTHFAVLDYAATRDGKPLAGAKGTGELVDMSAEQSVEGLTEGLLGMKRGETKVIKVKLGGKDAELTATLTEIKVKVLPPVDAEFAKDLGFDSVEQLRAKLKEVLDKEGAARAETEEIQQIEKALVKANTFPLPPSMVERQLEGMLERMKARVFGGANLNDKVLADLKAKMLPQAEDEVRLAFVLNAIAEKEKLEATEAELKAELEKGLAEEADPAKQAEMKQAFERRKDSISHVLRERKVVAFLREKAAYKDA